MVFIFIFKKKNKGISIVKIRQFRPKKMHGIQVLCNLTISSIKEVECRWVGGLGGVPPSCWKKINFVALKWGYLSHHLAIETAKQHKQKHEYLQQKKSRQNITILYWLLKILNTKKKMRSNQINLYCCYNISNVNDYEAKKKNLKLYHDNNQIRW